MSSPAATDMDWASAGDLTELLTHLALDKYFFLFQEQEVRHFFSFIILVYSVVNNCMYTLVIQIDMATFLTLTDQDLRELGITTFGARRKMLLAIDGECFCQAKRQ